VLLVMTLNLAQSALIIISVAPMISVLSVPVMILKTTNANATLRRGIIRHQTVNAGSALRDVLLVRTLNLVQSALITITVATMISVMSVLVMILKTTNVNATLRRGIIQQTANARNVTLLVPLAMLVAPKIVSCVILITI